MRYYIVLFFLFAGLFEVRSQSYRTAAGLRIGNNMTLSISQRIVAGSTLDFYHQSSLLSPASITALAYKKHVPLITKRLNLFGGIGPYCRTGKNGMSNEVVLYRFSSCGMLLTGGIDFTIGRLNLGYDFMPVVRLVGSDPIGRVSASSAITLRYVLIKQPKPFKSWLKKKKKRR